LPSKIKTVYLWILKKHKRGNKKYGKDTFNNKKGGGK
jgi:hypothetical protein